MRVTSIEKETDLLADSQHTYLKIMLCGDILHTRQLYKQYSAKDSKGNISYRMWFRQIKPLLYMSDFTVASLRTYFPNYTSLSSQTAAPDEFLGELNYAGFNVLMTANGQAVSKNPQSNHKTMRKLDALGLYRAGIYTSAEDRRRNFPLVLDKKDIRLAFLNYTMDTAIQFPENQILNTFQWDSVQRDILRAKQMLTDYTIVYMDWGDLPDSAKLTIQVQMIQAGVDVIVGEGGKGITTADVLTYVDGKKKILLNNLGAVNTDTISRYTDRTAMVEVVLKRNKLTQQVTMHDMGFLPIWTLMDDKRYAVLPISNMEEKHIKNVNLNLDQYSSMKEALTDLRYTFFEKIPEIHYDYDDETVNNVEQTTFLRKTIMNEQDKINEEFVERSLDRYSMMFGQLPPKNDRYVIYYEDELKIYNPKKKAVDINTFQNNDLDTTDLTAENGIVNIKANKIFYTREKDTARPLTAREKFMKDSALKYQQRFFPVDSVAILREKIKRQRAEQKRVRDSVYLTTIDPNYVPKVAPIYEPAVSNPAPSRKEVYKGGIFTTTGEETKEDNSPVKEIEEYFVVQVYTFSKNKALDLTKEPYLSGYEVRQEDGVYRYYIGRTRSSALAVEICKQMRAKGIGDAIVVRFTDGKRYVYKSDF